MTNENIAWVAGLFEGEGTFEIQYGNGPKGIKITSTDLDVLHNVQNIFGGKVLTAKNPEDKPHWKTKFNWVLGIDESIEFVELILPYLGIRRSSRGSFYLTIAKEAKKIRDTFKINQADRHTKILELSVAGKTHKQIADAIGLERSSVSKILKNLTN